MLNFRVRVRVLGFVEKWGFRRESQHGGKCVWVGQTFSGVYISYIYIYIHGQKYLTVYERPRYLLN